MEKFYFFWSSLLFMVMVTGYCASITIFISWCFIVLTIVCVVCSVKLISSAFKEAQLLKKTQKHDLTIKLHKSAYLFFLVTFCCLLIITKDSNHQNIASTAIGLGCICNCVLSLSLRNLLGS